MLEREAEESRFLVAVQIIVVTGGKQKLQKHVQEKQQVQEGLPEGGSAGNGVDARHRDNPSKTGSAGRAILSHRIGEQIDFAPQIRERPTAGEDRDRGAAILVVRLGRNH